MSKPYYLQPSDGPTWNVLSDLVRPGETVAVVTDLDFGELVAEALNVHSAAIELASEVDSLNAGVLEIGAGKMARLKQLAENVYALIEGEK